MRQTTKGSWASSASAERTQILHKAPSRKCTTRKEPNETFLNKLKKRHRFFYWFMPFIWCIKQKCLRISNIWNLKLEHCGCCCCLTSLSTHRDSASERLDLAWRGAWGLGRLGWDGENRVLHRGHVSLRGSIENIADKKVCLLHPIRQKRGTVFRSFTHHTTTFVVSHTKSTSFVVSHTIFRSFTHHLS